MLAYFHLSLTMAVHSSRSRRKAQFFRPLTSSAAVNDLGTLFSIRMLNIRCVKDLSTLLAIAVPNYYSSLIQLWSQEALLRHSKKIRKESDVEIRWQLFKSINWIQCRKDKPEKTKKYLLSIELVCVVTVSRQTNLCSYVIIKPKFCRVSHDQFDN